MKRICADVFLCVAIALSIAAIVMCVLSDCGLVRILHKVQTPQANQIRIACVGDSLTYGFGIPDHNRAPYPAQLQTILGDEYCVNNYGYSGRTASNEGDRPYRAEQVYQDSLDFAPEVVIVMLGSNDTKPFNWQSDEHYLAQYRALIESYIALPSVKKLIVMAPTPVFEKNGKVPYQINRSLIDRLPQLASGLYEELLPTLQQKGIEGRFVNLYPVFEGKSQLFSDGAHPTKEGAAIIARLVAEQILA